MNLLSIIIASSNPKLAALTVSQAYKQAEGLPIEIICVAEGFTVKQLPKLQCVRYVEKSLEGYAGAFAKDRGVSLATGEYVTFWDDDNFYYQNAISDILTSLLFKPMISIFKVEHLTPSQNYTIPRENPTNGFTMGDIDTMCFIVNKYLANRVLWSEHKGKQTDFAWISKINKLSQNVKFNNIVIGQKITTYG
jgi:hypothetical protein